MAALSAKRSIIWNPVYERPALKQKRWGLNLLFFRQSFLMFLINNNSEKQKLPQQNNTGKQQESGSTGYETRTHNTFIDITFLWAWTM